MASLWIVTAHRVTSVRRPGGVRPLPLSVAVVRDRRLFPGQCVDGVE